MTQSANDRPKEPPNIEALAIRAAQRLGMVYNPNTKNEILQQAILSFRPLWQAKLLQWGHHPKLVKENRLSSKEKCRALWVVLHS